MGYLPRHHPRLGAVDVDRVFEWHDGPLLFSARNELGYAFLALAVEPTRYLYVPTSEDRLLSVQTGLVSVRSAFAEPEVPSLFLVGFEGEVSELAPSDVEPDWLPSPHFYLEEKLETALSFSPARLLELSRRQGRRLVALEFAVPDGSSRTEFPVRDAASILGEFQELTSVVHAETPRSGTRTNKDEQVELDAELGVVFIAAASFVVVLAPFQGDRLFAPTDPAVETIIELLAASEDDDRLVDAVRPFGRRTVAHLRDFLTALSDADTSVQVFNASPTGELAAVNVPVESARASIVALRAKTALKPRRLMVIGHLMAIDHLRRTFKIRALPTGRQRVGTQHRGIFDHEVARTVDGLATGTSTVYEFNLLVDREISEFDDERESPIKRLVGLREVNQRLGD